MGEKMQLNSVSTNCDIAAIATEFLRNPEKLDCLLTRMAEGLFREAIHECIHCKKKCEIHIVL